MKVKTEASGHQHHHGATVIREDFYLKNGDHRYAEFGASSPCHTHFRAIEPTLTDAEIQAIVENDLNIFETAWNADSFFEESNTPKMITSTAAYQSNPTQQRIDDCVAKANDLKTKNFEKDKNGQGGESIKPK